MKFSELQDLALAEDCLSYYYSCLRSLYLRKHYNPFNDDIVKFK